MKGRPRPDLDDLDISVLFLLSFSSLEHLSARRVVDAELQDLERPLRLLGRLDNFVQRLEISLLPPSLGSEEVCGSILDAAPDEGAADRVEEEAGLAEGEEVAGRTGGEGRRDEALVEGMHDVEDDFLR